MPGSILYSPMAAMLSNMNGCRSMAEIVRMVEHEICRIIPDEELEKYAYHWLPGEYESDENDGVLGLVAYVARDYLNRGAGQKKVFGLSVRCVQDY